MQELLERAVGAIPQRQLWVNPDCGLKTRGYDETVASLENMLAATRAVRAELASARRGCRGGFAQERGIAGVSVGHARPCRTVDPVVSGMLRCIAYGRMRLAVTDRQRNATRPHPRHHVRSRAWHGSPPSSWISGFRVLAVDLAGHGTSPRARRYSPRAWADDVVETLEPLLTGPPDVVMGHSLGGLVASLVADRLAPRAAIYIDPAFAFPSGIRGALFKLFFASRRGRPARRSCG